MPKISLDKSRSPSQAILDTENLVDSLREAAACYAQHKITSNRYDNQQTAITVRGQSQMNKINQVKKQTSQTTNKNNQSNDEKKAIRNAKSSLTQSQNNPNLEYGMHGYRQTSPMR